MDFLAIINQIQNSKFCITDNDFGLGEGADFGD